MWDFAQEWVHAHVLSQLPMNGGNYPVETVSEPVAMLDVNDLHNAVNVVWALVLTVVTARRLPPLLDACGKVTIRLLFGKQNFGHWNARGRTAHDVHVVSNKSFRIVSNHTDDSDSSESSDGASRLDEPNDVVLKDGAGTTVLCQQDGLHVQRNAVRKVLCFYFDECCQRTVAWQHVTGVRVTSQFDVQSARAAYGGAVQLAGGLQSIVALALEKRFGLFWTVRALVNTYTFVRRWLLPPAVGHVLAIQPTLLYIAALFNALLWSILKAFRGAALLLGRRKRVPRHVHEVHINVAHGADMRLNVACAGLSHRELSRLFLAAPRGRRRFFD
ncbi:MAG: hypothetical protein MHM6MM_006758 [Cercozoa sp. M6MM]